MLQVDENIGGRQYQKYNGLRTKTLAVGLLMMVGCFVVGYLGATTTRASQELTTNNIPNDAAQQCTDDGYCLQEDYNCCSKTVTFDPDCCTANKGICVRCGRKGYKHFPSF